MARFVQFLTVAAMLLCGAWAHAAEPLPQPTGPVVLTISGRIAVTNAPGQARFDRAMLDALGTSSIRTGSAWSDRVELFEGVPLKAVLDRVGATGTKMTASALNDYEIDIPFTDLQFSPLLAMRVDGRELTIRDKGPLWIVYPRDDHEELKSEMFDSRWVWQLKQLRVE